MKYNDDTSEEYLRYCVIEEVVKLNNPDHPEITMKNLSSEQIADLWIKTQAEAIEARNGYVARRFYAERTKKILPEPGMNSLVPADLEEQISKFAFSQDASSVEKTDSLSIEAIRRMNFGKIVPAATDGQEPVAASGLPAAKPRDKDTGPALP